MKAKERLVEIIECTNVGFPRSFIQRGFGNNIIIRCPQCKITTDYDAQIISGNPTKSGMKCWNCGYEDCVEGEAIK